MFGEFKSLESLEQAGIVRVPKPIKVFTFEDTTLLVTEFLHFTGLDSFQAQLGEQLAKYYNQIS